MTSTQAKRLTWGVDPIAWQAYADWCEEHDDNATADLWRGRAATANAYRRCVERIGKQALRQTVREHVYPGIHARIVFHPCRVIAMVQVRSGSRSFVDCNFLMRRLNDPGYTRRRIFELAESVARAVRYETDDNDCQTCPNPACGCFTTVNNPVCRECGALTQSIARDPLP